MKIIVDAFGGDNSPDEVIKGAAMAVEQLGVEIVLTGNENIIKKFASDNGVSLNGTEIMHTESVIDIHEEPTSILKEYAKNHLVLVITHDRSILKGADSIIEMWDGDISAIKGGDAV